MSVVTEDDEDQGIQIKASDREKKSRRKSQSPDPTNNEKEDV